MGYYYEKHRRYADKYIAEHYERMNLKLFDGERDLIGEAALRKGMSFNFYVQQAVLYAIEHTNEAYYSPVWRRICRVGEDIGKSGFNLYTIRFKKDDYRMMCLVAQSQALSHNLFVVDAIYDQMRRDGFIKDTP